LRLRIDIWVWRYGTVWWVIASLGVLACMASIAMQYSQTQWQTLQDSQNSMQAQQRRAAELAAQPAQHTGDEMAWLQSLEQLSLSAPEVTAAVRQIQRIAQHSGVALEQSEFQYSSNGYASLRRLQISLPMHASYPEVKSFAEQVLLQMPAVSLDAMQIKRDSAQTNAPQVLLRFSLWVRAEESASESAPAPAPAPAPTPAPVPLRESP
jgi:Tfp pilus assembly protein PilO